MTTYATHYLKTKSFYEATLDRLGYSIQCEMEFDSDPGLPGRRACAFGPKQRSVFWVIEVDEPASPRHVAFAADDRKSVYEFHQTGLAAGGLDNGAPALRPIYHEHYYGGFLIDPDANNVEAVCHTPEYLK